MWLWVLKIPNPFYISTTPKYKSIEDLFTGLGLKGISVEILEFGCTYIFNFLRNVKRGAVWVRLWGYQYQ